jgi:hypothetical protein
VRFSHIEPTSEEFFRAADKQGGPTDPVAGFKDVYTEIYIKRAKPAAGGGLFGRGGGTGEDDLSHNLGEQTEERK